MKRFSVWTTLLVLLSMACMTSVQAATQARLERDRIALGESVTLTIETGVASAAPDLAPLREDFELGSQSSSRQMQVANGNVTAQTLHTVVLVPKVAGVLPIPPLQVGTERTAPLALTVVEGQPASDDAGNADVFLETEIDDVNPYVQQSVGVTIRLHYAMPLASGQLDLESPEGTLLQRAGDDVQFTKEVNGRRYNVVERRYLLVPERSGPLTVPAPRFAGRGSGNWMDDLLGGRSREMRAQGQPQTLDVRPQPDQAPQPWLPLRDLRLRYVETPQAARAGEAATLVVEAVAQGATRAQFPDLPAPVVPGAQVFADPPQYDESFVAGTPQLKMTRRYSIVPNAAGALGVTGLKMPWWDVRNGQAQMASLPDLTLEVEPGTGGFATTASPSIPGVAGDEVEATAIRVPTKPSLLPVSAWIGLAVGFALLWLLTLAWALRRRRHAIASSGLPVGRDVHAAAATHTQADLKRALDTGTLDEVAETLCGMGRPPAAELDELVARLAQPAQRSAVEQLRRARWADGDAVHARKALREAFRDGPVWQGESGAAPMKALLPPLYPER